MIVCIAEKPSVAKEIALIVGAKSKRDGYFEGNNYQVTWTFGHLCTLKEPHEYLPEWKRWSMGWLPMIPSRFGIKLIGDGGIEKQFKTIEKLVQGAEEVVNCGDAGQEGELIQRWVLHKAGTKCPVKRLWISSLTEEAIREGFEKLRAAEEFNNLYAAGSSRAIGDWLLGINATRLYTLKYGQQGQVLSIGRVQTPTLALIVERQKAIDNFVTEPFWELKTKYRDVVFAATKGRFTKKEEGDAYLETIKTSEFVIKDFSKKKGKEAPPRLFDLTSLQVECNKKFGFSAEETLKTIQSLYEKKLTTYPRVDTTFLSNDIYPKVPGILKGMKDHQHLTEPLLKAKLKKSKKVFDDKKVTDHHAIIPTGVYANNMGRDEKLVYELVARRFIAAFYPDATISNTQVLGDVNGVEFKATGKQLLEPGWRTVFMDGKETEKKQDDIMPEFTVGEKGAHEPLLIEKETQPPKPYTEATLLRAMETAGKHVDDEELRDAMKENGIGRPSTRAAIIETITRRKYIAKVRKNLHPTVTGMQLIDTITNELLKSAELTGIWEKKLREIEKGQYDAGEFMDELKQMVSDIVFHVKHDRSDKKIEIVSEEEKLSKPAKKEKPVKKVELLCPQCKKGSMLKGKTAWGCSAYKDGCKTLLPFDFLNKKLSDKQIEQLILKGKTSKIKGFVDGGEKVDGVILLDGTSKMVFEKVEAEAWHCPVCKVGTVVKGKTAYGCNNFKNGCRLRLPFEFMGKKLTEKQIEALVFKQKTPQIKGLKNPETQELINGRIILDANGGLSVE
ncbi:type IA DNA topoisomerase [Carboxylicivirga sp. M1479]|uniref:type IA DNA topoisomerase n=1 Tax=Carboxylicivirga sp. M1479 TaxID=2594476 RepID=UPI001178636D|nr:type IA DNA topoisomerase [Carboxylicivirga sp. M1479]TRX66014.1 DNA topoisomerase III [Carboxylicivirga sp. M1479]